MDNIKTIPLDFEIPVALSSIFKSKVLYMCNRIHEVEWSGILLYTVSGDNFKDIEIMLEDIIPMDKGSHATTEYEYNTDNKSGDNDDKMIDYFEAHPEAFDKDYKIGHIHSHNNMNVYFSATDMSEIIENSKAHDYYLSIIVNNRLDVIGKITISNNIEKSSSPVTVTMNGKLEKITDTIIKESSRICYTIDCEIIDNLHIDDELFMSQVEDIDNKILPTIRHNHFSSRNNFNTMLSNHTGHYDVEELVKIILIDVIPVKLYKLPTSLEKLLKVAVSFYNKWVTKSMSYYRNKFPIIKQYVDRYGIVTTIDEIETCLYDIATENSLTKVSHIINTLKK